MATNATSNQQARWRKPTWRSGARLALSTLVFSTLALSIAMTPASAQSGCGDYSYGFEGTRLLNDGISNSAGPYPIDLPAGTYTVTLVAQDHHSTQPDIPSQANEQYRVVLDSGYASPASTDIPDDADTTTTVVSGQVIGRSNAISVHHIGTPGINSVNVVCVGFTIEAALVEPVPPLTAEPAPVEAPEEPAVDEPTDVPEQPTIPEDVVQDIGDPVGIIGNPDVPAPDAAPAEASPVAPPATVAAPPSPEPPAESPTAQVAGITLVQDTDTQAQVPLLAITGPGTGAIALTGFGLLFLSVGLMLLQSERHFSRRP